MTDYKKAWNKLKKDLMANEDPLHLKGCMYMTSQQIVNHTATIDLGHVNDDEGKSNCKAKAEAITSASAFKRFEEEIGVKSVSYEIKENAYYSDHMYMRIRY